MSEEHVAYRADTWPDAFSNACIFGFLSVACVCATIVVSSIAGCVEKVDTTKAASKTP